MHQSAIIIQLCTILSVSAEHFTSVDLHEFSTVPASLGKLGEVNKDEKIPYPSQIKYRKCTSYIPNKGLQLKVISRKV